MLSFTELTKENIDSLVERLKKELGDSPYVAEIVDSFTDYIDDTGDTGVGVCASHGCFIARIFDMGRYVFVYPVEVTECALAEKAADCVREYAVREEVPLVFVDVPREEIAILAALLRHMNVDAEDTDAEAYRIEARSECSLLSEIPEYKDSDIELSRERESDIEKIAALARDAEVNEYWGYDFREDVSSDVCDYYFFNEAEEEFKRGVAMTLAVRYRGEFVGECVYYAFDYKGGCEIAIRIMKDFWGKKIGSRTLSLAISLAKSIGLLNLYTVIDKRNLRSIGMVEGEFELVKREGGRLYYKREIY